MAYGLRPFFARRPDVSAPIDFYFDFASPYSYVASHLLEQIAERHQRAVIWHPLVIGYAFKAVGGAALPSLPMRHDYVDRDIARLARYLKLPYRQPSHHAIPTHHAAHAFLWGQDRDPDRARGFANRVFAAYFTEDRNIGDVEVVLDIIESFDFGRVEASAAITSPAMKERLKAETEVAISRGVFGVPFAIVGGEPFWGYSRLNLLEKWIAEGPF